MDIFLSKFFCMYSFDLKYLIVENGTSDFYKMFRKHFLKHFLIDCPASINRSGIIMMQVEHLLSKIPKLEKLFICHK